MKFYSVGFEKLLLERVLWIMAENMLEIFEGSFPQIGMFFIGLNRFYLRIVVFSGC